MTRDREALALALVLCWAQDHEIPAQAALQVVARPGIGASDRLAAARRELLESGPGPEVEELAAQVAGETVLPGMLELVTGRGSPAEALAALTRERWFGAIARRLTVQILRALAVGVRLPPARPAATIAREPGLPGVVALRELALPTVRLASSLRDLVPGRSDRPVDAPAWERRFHELKPLPLEVSRLSENAARLSLSAEFAATGLSVRLGELLGLENLAFAVRYRDETPRIWTEEVPPLWPHRVLDPLIAGIRERLSPPATLLIVVDAMRHDFFDVLESGYLSSPASGLSRVALHVVWSLSPTVTALNMRALVEGRVPRASDVSRDAPEEDVSDAGIPFTLVVSEGIELEYVSVIDEHVHGCTLGLAALADAVMPVVAGRVASVVNRAPAGSLIVITADHGFTPLPCWRPRTNRRRYRHGGLDLFEVLVPLAVYRKGCAR